MHRNIIYASIVIIILAVILAIVLMILKYFYGGENFESSVTIPQPIENLPTESNNMMPSTSTSSIPPNIPTSIPPNIPTSIPTSIPTNNQFNLPSITMDLTGPTSNYTIPFVKPASSDSITMTSTTTTTTTQPILSPLQPSQPSHNADLYTRFNETYIDDSGLDKNVLYQNYTGNMQQNTVWTNVNLDQCYDMCNKMNGCVGFSRSTKTADTEAGTCYPRTSIDTCYSARKGTKDQRTNSFNYTTYIKNSTRHMKTRCLGDPSITLGQPIVIKSAQYPSKYIGIDTDNYVKLMELPKQDESMIEFNKACKFEIILGLDGSGTVAIKHIDTNKVLYRSGDIQNSTLDTMDNDAISKTEDKQRASFYLYNGNNTGNIKFLCYQLAGETKDKFITVPTGSPIIFTIAPSADKNDSSQDFEILDILDNQPVASMDNKSSEKSQFADVTEEQINLDRIKMLLNGTSTSTDFKNYMDENYMSNYDFGNKQAAIIQAKVLAARTGQPTIGQSSQTLQDLQNQNSQFEDILNKQNNDISSNYQNLYSKLNKMHVDDYLNDYYYLQNLVKK